MTSFATMIAMTVRSEILLIGGRSGVGKSSVGAEIHAQLAAADVRHCLVEGDNLDMAHPAPHEHHLAERNLTALWANYRALDYRRMIYTNTASVFPAVINELTTAMGDTPAVTAVLLTCSDATARARLSQRERGSMLDSHVERSRVMASRLDDQVSNSVHRVATDGRTVVDIATEIVGIVGWAHAA